MSLELKSNQHQNNLKDVKPADCSIYEFDGFRLESANLMLYRNGEEISLTPKQVETLLALVERSGEIVSKDDLMERLWADAFVEESNLIQNIYVLRKILGDTAEGKPMIETLRRRGYRFNGQLKAHEPAQPEIASEQQSAVLLKFPAANSDKESKPKTDDINVSGRSRWGAAIGIFAFLIAAIALGYYFSSQKTATVAGKKSIAVLPLKPINTANRDDIYEIGIPDSLILRLSSMKGIIVRPLSATRNYADVGQDPLAAGREQRVDYVLASNYQLAGGKIKITAQLFNVSNGQIEETYKTEKDAGDIFAMQDAIAGEVGNLLSARFATTSNSPAAKRGTNSEEAYRLYLQGMYLYDKRNLADARKAVEVFEQAVRLDPNYALAWAGKAHAHRSVGNLRLSINITEEYQNSIEAINKALALDENLADAHSALCDNKMYYEYDFDGAERECKRAIELDPNSSLARQIYARFLNSRGRDDEAIAEIKTAIDIEPASLLNQRVYGTCLYFARRYDEAAAQLKRVIDMDKNFSNAYVWLIYTLTAQGNHPEAFEWWMKYLALQKTDEETMQTFQTAYQRSGWQGVMRERAKRFEKSDETYFQGATYNAQLSDKDKAFEYLEKSYQRRELWMANLQVDPRLDLLRDDPRFVELVRRVESK